MLQHPDLWKYATIPVVAAVVGWSTNWVAIKLTFLPLEFRGLLEPWLGWQGIIPSKARKMSETFVDSTMYRLGSLPELFASLEPERIAQHVRAVVDKRLDRYTDEVMLQDHAVLWNRLPARVKEEIYSGVRREIPALIDNLMTDIGEHIEELIDFKHMITTRLVEDKALLNRLFLEAGDAEFRFIVRSGLYFGFAFGLVQLAVWIFLPLWWVLPLFGLLVGYATNWIALNIIFRPLHPKKLGPFTLHGLFLRRQKEVAASWCRLVTREILTLRALMRAMLEGPRSENTHALIRRHIAPVADRAVGMARGVAQLTVGASGFESIRRTIGDKAIDVSAEPFDDWIFNKERARVIESLLRERMEGLPSDEFQDLLRPCFQEDEMKLILAGAVLGLLAGFAQLLLMFGGIA